MISRREFLVDMAAVSGGLLLGTKLAFASGLARRSENGGVTSFNAWIHIGGDGQVKFILDKVEMGQGIMTGLAAIVAEEMDISPNDIKVYFAPPGRKFGN